VKSSTAGCEYGDRADWCSTEVAYNCYQSAIDCCETCQRFYDSRYPGRPTDYLSSHPKLSLSTKELKVYISRPRYEADENLTFALKYNDAEHFRNIG